MSQYDYDLFVIGGGSGGVRAARIAAQHGARVGLAEGYRYGGTCVIRGCVPKKLLVYASRFPHAFHDAAGFGWGVGESAFDWTTLIANKDAEIARLEGVYRANLERAGVTLHDSYARFTDPHTLTLESGETLTAETILIATGGTPNVDPALPGREHVITSNEVFHLEEFPQRIVIAGGGYIAMEFASIFAGLGAETTLIYRRDLPLRGFDDDVRKHVHAEMAANGVNFVLGEVFTKIEKTDAGLIGHTSGGQVLEADQIMFAIGRKPVTDTLDLEAAGVETGDGGEVRVDAHSRSNVPHIYAVGDVTDRINLTPVAIREGHAFADSLYGGRPWQADHADVATAVFTSPEIGTVGLTEAQAREALDDVVIYASSFRPMKATLSGADGKMLLKLVVDGATDRIVGIHVVGEDAGELIQTLGIAVKMGATKSDFDATMAVHPTAAEELVTMREPSARHTRD